MSPYGVLLLDPLKWSKVVGWPLCDIEAVRFCDDDAEDGADQSSDSDGDSSKPDTSSSEESDNGKSSYCVCMRLI